MDALQHDQHVVMTPRGTVLKRPGPKGGVRDTNRARRSSAIKDAALALFLERGIEGVSVDDIMKTARMAKGSFYRYFSDQAGLVEELMSPLASEIRMALASAQEALAGHSADPLGWALSPLARAVTTLVETQPLPTRLYLQESRAPGVGARRPIAALAAEVLSGAVHLAADAERLGLLKPAVSPTVTALTLIGGGERLVQWTLERAEPPQDLYGTLFTALFDGLKLQRSAPLRLA